MFSCRNTIPKHFFIFFFYNNIYLPTIEEKQKNLIFS